MSFFRKKYSTLLLLTLLTGVLSPLTAAEKAVVLRKYDFNKGTFGWVTPGYWTGKSTRNAANGTMTLTPESRNGSPIYGRAYTQSGLMDVRGQKLELSCRVRGSGKVKLGAYFAVMNGKNSKWVYGDVVTLTGEWQTITFPMDFSGKGIHTIWPVIAITTAGKLEYDDMIITSYQNSDSTVIKGQDVIRRHVDGAPFPAVKFETSEPNKEFAVFAGTADTVEAPVMLKSDARGVLTVPGDLIKRRRDNQALVTVARNGVSCRTVIELITPEQYQALDNAAKKITFNENTSIAVLADSLWDFDRGWNAADELDFWLNKYNPGKIKVHNFAVRGNSIVTDELRFYQQVTAFNWIANKAMFAPQLNPGIVLIQLGHNDTRSFSGEKFAKPWVTPEEQLAAFRRMITNLRRMWPASRIILVTPVANDTAYAAQKSANEVRRGQPSWRFGDAEKVQTYIAKLHEIASEFQLEVCDVFTPMSKIADRQKTMFRADGVHLVRAGYWFLGQQLLEYLSKNPQAPAIKPLPESAPYRARFVLKDISIPAPGVTSPGILRSVDGSRNMLGFGKLTKLPDGAVRMDGSTTGFGLDDSVNFNANNGITLSMTCKNNALEHPQHKALFGSYFFKANQFLFCRHNRCLYFNYHTGSSWGQGVNSSDVFEEEYGKESYHHIAATIKRHKVPSQGEDWLEVKLYFDGELVARKRLNNVKLPESRFPLEIGSASHLGTVWRSKADVAEVEIIDRVLNESEIEELFARQMLVSKKRTGVLTPIAEQLLADSTAAPEKISALRNLALLGTDDALLKKYAGNPDKYFITLPGKDSTLTILNDPGKVRIVSWFDRKAGREILAPASPVFSVKGVVGNRAVTLSPLSGQVVSNFTVQPVKDGDKVKFVIKSDLGNNAFAETAYTFVADRLEFHVSTDCANSKLKISEVIQPDLQLNALNSPYDTLLAPIMSGVEYPAAAASGANYNDIYPHGTASMQLGAYYDNKGGIYWTLLDPRAAYKGLSYQSGSKRTTVKVTFPVPGPVNAPQKVYTATAPAAVELFRGNWYDVGLLYRRDLAGIKAPWWRESLPNTDTPEWFRNNALYVRRLGGTRNDGPYMKKLRDYLECTFLISDGDNSGIYSPLRRMSPENVAWMRDMHKLGLRVMPYTDPRLWAQRDRRDEDVLYSKLGKYHCVVEGGKVLVERYGKELCGVTCPVSPVIQQYMQKLLINITNLGYDGIYADQIGAARPNLCENANHGHIVRDNAAHYIDGWYKLFTGVRKHWQADGENKILATEDNAEQCVNIFDAMLPWRWMYDNQVPLYCMVYAGRTQFIGREPDCEDPRAIYPKAASQIVNSEQIGFLEYQLLCSPLRNEYRVFLKRIMHLRFAMLDFFNAGMMARPPQFARSWKKVTLTWGARGTQTVATEDVVYSAWNKDDVWAFMLINHTPEVKSNEMLYKLPANRNNVLIWNSHSDRVVAASTGSDLRLPISMEPRSMMLVICAPEKYDLASIKVNMEKHFAVIRRAPQTPDPFVLNAAAMRDRNAGKAGDLHQARDVAEVVGGRRDEHRNQINWIRDAVVSVGTVDFGNGSGRDMHAAFAAPPRCGFGTVSFYIDNLEAANKIAEFAFDGVNFSTGNWNTFAIRKTELLRKVSGSHRVFIKLEGNSFCNLQSWQIK